MEKRRPESSIRNIERIILEHLRMNYSPRGVELSSGIVINLITPFASDLSNLIPSADYPIIPEIIVTLAREITFDIRKKDLKNIHRQGWGNILRTGQTEIDLLRQWVCAGNSIWVRITGQGLRYSDDLRK